jgi:membrane protein required for colicin V production
MNEFSTLDITISVIVLFSLYRGFKAGLVASLVGLVGWFATLYVGTHYARGMGYVFASVVKDPVLQTAIAFLVIVLLMLMIVWGVSLILKSLINALALTPLEKLAGGVFGAVRGVLIVLVVMSFVSSWASTESWWNDSVLAKSLLTYAPLALAAGHQLATTAWSEINPHHLTEKQNLVDNPMKVNDTSSD